MKKVFTGVVLVILLIIVVSLVKYYSDSSKASKAITPIEVSENIDTSVIQNTSDSVDSSAIVNNYGTYSPFSTSIFDASASKKRVLFFYASWCSTCRPTDKDISEKISQIPADIAVIRVNYNDPDTDSTEKALAAKYGVTYQHTFVQVDSLGNEITKWNGGDLSDLLKNLK